MELGLPGTLCARRVLSVGEAKSIADLNRPGLYALHSLREAPFTGSGRVEPGPLPFVFRLLHFAFRAVHQAIKILLKFANPEPSQRFHPWH